MAFDNEIDFMGSMPPALVAAGEIDDFLRYMTKLITVRLGQVPSQFSRTTDPDFTLWIDLPTITIPARMTMSDVDPNTGVCDIETINDLVIPPATEAANGLVTLVIGSVNPGILHEHFYEDILNDESVNEPNVADNAFVVDIDMRGDMLRDRDGVVVDAEHVTPFLPGRVSGNGLAGGTFNSCLYFNRAPTTARPAGGIGTSIFNSLSGTQPLGLNINTASLDELVSLPGIGSALAERMVASRPIASEADLTNIPGIGTQLAAQLRGRITFG